MMIGSVRAVVVIVAMWLVVMTGEALGQVGGKGEPDLSTPQAADKALREAMRSGEAAAIRKLVIYPPHWEKVIDALAELRREEAKLVSVVVKRWGKDAPVTWIPLHDPPLPDGYVFKITGDTAALVDEKYPQFPTPRRYKRVGGKWKHDWLTGSTPAEAERMVAQHRDDIRITIAFTKRLEAGEFKDARWADKEYRDALSAKYARAAAAEKAGGGATTRGATTRPATRPSR
jgi:hypothetical protein